MIKPQIITINPTYRKENGLWVKDLKLEGFSESSLVHIPSRQFGGNHTHPRIEVFLALSEGLELNWIDESGAKHTLIMKSEHNSKLTLYQIPPKLPHAVFNASLTESYMLEFASEPQHDVQLAKII